MTGGSIAGGGCQRGDGSIDLGGEKWSSLPRGAKLWKLDIPGQAERSECGDAVPIHIEFVPGEAVTRGLWRGMVIIVPALAESKYSNPKTVGGGIAGKKALRSPQDRKSTRLNSSHRSLSRMPSSA